VIDGLNAAESTLGNMGTLLLSDRNDLVIGDLLYLDVAESAPGNIAATRQRRIADTDDSEEVWQYFGRPSA
jgi:hypothetical protein